MSEFVHFISDLHLAQDRPENTQRFLAYLDALSADVSKLYILGDLFDVWVGDDDPTPPNTDVIEALASLAKKGISAFFLAGNRDFLVGNQFYQNSHVTALEDEYIIDLFGEKTLLMHGDLLCTDDVQYQQFRHLTHQVAWQQDMLAKPLAERLAIAQHYRQESHLNKKEKSASIMDVNERAVISMMEKHQVQRLIHGHTHRPKIHTHQVNGQAAQRFVLDEWASDGSVLEWRADGYKIFRLA